MPYGLLALKERGRQHVLGQGQEALLESSCKDLGVRITECTWEGARVPLTGLIESSYQQWCTSLGFLSGIDMVPSIDQTCSSSLPKPLISSYFRQLLPELPSNLAFLLPAGRPCFCPSAGPWHAL